MTSVLYIGNNLKDRRRNITGIAHLGPLLEQEGIQVFYASSQRNKVVRLLDMLYTCWKYNKKVDYVLIDTYSTLNFWYAVWVAQLCRMFKLKYIPILHGGNLETRLKQSPLWSQRLFNHAHVNIAPSRFMENTFARYGYTHLKYIPNSIDLDNYQFKSRPLQEPQILWVRSFSNIYNPELAVKVLKCLRDEGIKAYLCMVGPDSGDGSLEATKSLAEALELEVYFTGKLSKEKWIALSQDYNLFINTTNFDNMPVSVIEAMALGLPVVSTNVGGMPYLITHEKDGILVNPNAEAEFVDAIKILISNPERLKAMTMAARQKAEAFDWSVVREQWLTILK
ncbi:glycosyltransferase family 4 protein [Aestuariivivens sediminicola]|uniref:glycosyltransferase family 4 protein n=1 Tax=Aestuariivivens sediminicola TaxID=2913560 RepID=UPI001F594CA3|nr:glycosyltransferase family 4 protein [Aestuariivivens sediminicola]